MTVADFLLWAQTEAAPPPSTWTLPSWLPSVINVLIILVSAFLILLVLIQRGKGGGLAGAFGGAGGSSAFGSRAGDQFTQITLITAGIWVLLIMLMIKMMPRSTTTTQASLNVPAIHRTDSGVA